MESGSRVGNSGAKGSENSGLGWNDGGGRGSEKPCTVVVQILVLEVRKSRTTLHTQSNPNLSES